MGKKGEGSNAKRERLEREKLARELNVFQKTGAMPGSADKWLSGKDVLSRRLPGSFERRTRNGDRSQILLRGTPCDPYSGVQARR